jgi:hypothetical protein
MHDLGASKSDLLILPLCTMSSGLLSVLFLVVLAPVEDTAPFAVAPIEQPLWAETRPDLAKTSHPDPTPHILEQTKGGDWMSRSCPNSLSYYFGAEQEKDVVKRRRK